MIEYIPSICDVILTVVCASGWWYAYRIKARERTRGMNTNENEDEGGCLKTFIELAVLCTVYGWAFMMVCRFVTAVEGIRDAVVQMAQE